MTARKHLKQLVRDRMRTTGERYTVARRHVVAAGAAPAWELRGGVHADTAALANVLANLGVVAPGSDEPLSEAMVLGIGGGLGAGYILWEFAATDYRSIVLGFRRLWQYPARWASETAERLGLHAEIHETAGAKSAAAALDAQLERGLPAIVWADTETLGHRFEPRHRNAFGGPPVVIYRHTGGGFLVDDRSTAVLTVPADRLAEARGRVVSYKNRLIAIDPELVDLDADRLRAAVEEGLRLQVEHLTAKSDSFSLPAWRKWARMTTDTRNPKGWPTVFADGRSTGSIRASIYTNAGEGVALRRLYATFLDEAAALLSRPSLGDAGGAWRAAADAWQVIADLALPRGDELRDLIDRTDAAVARGDAGAAEAARVAAGRWALQAERDEAGEMPPLGDAVATMHAAEVAALDVLAKINR